MPDDESPDQPEQPGSAYPSDSPAGVSGRIECSPENIEQGLAKLVLSLIELLHQLLERPAAVVRPGRFHALPAPQGHAAPIRMHAGDLGRARQIRAAAGPRLRPAAPLRAAGPRRGRCGSQRADCNEI